MIPLASFVAGAAVFLLAAYVIRSRVLRPAEARVRALGLTSQVGTAVGQGGEVALLRHGPSETVVGRLVATSRYSERWQFQLDRAGLQLRTSEYFLIRLVLGALGIVVVTLIGRTSIALLISIPLGVLLYMLPAYWVSMRIQRRRNGIEKQLVETITLISNALRAGFAFAQGIDVAAKRMGPPISDELGRMLLDINLGMSTEEALQAMNARIGSDDLDMVVTAILIQRQSGGNLAEVLESVAETMRDRERIRGEIKTLTSSQRFTGWVLSLWPLALALMFFGINPDAFSIMWESAGGIALLLLWGFLNVMGIVTLQKILNIDV